MLEAASRRINESLIGMGFYKNAIFDRTGTGHEQEESYEESYEEAESYEEGKEGDESYEKEEVEERPALRRGELSFLICHLAIRELIKCL
jgi:hypothetical protein